MIVDKSHHEQPRPGERNKIEWDGGDFGESLW